MIVDLDSCIKSMAEDGRKKFSEIEKSKENGKDTGLRMRHDKLDLLKSKKIDYSISNKIMHFYKFYNLSGDSDPLSTYYNCQSIQYCKNGLTLLEDYLYPCVAPIALERAGLILSSQYGINLTSNVTKNDIIQLLCTPMNICSFCHMDYQERWHQLDEQEVDTVKSWSVI